MRGKFICSSGHSQEIVTSFSKEYLPEHVLIEQMINNFLPSIIPIILLLLIPTALVFGQTNPWALFQRLCQGGAFATGPQCQNLGPQCQNGVCVPTTSSTTTNGFCGTSAILQNGVCVPTTTSTTQGTCPTNFILQNGFCVPVTTTQTPP